MEFFTLQENCIQATSFLCSAKCALYEYGIIGGDVRGVNWENNF